MDAMFSWLGKYVSIPALVTYFGALISAFGAVWGLLLENQYVGRGVAVVVIGAFVSAGGALWSSGERTRFERELRDRSDEIAELNRRIAASVTGGDSFCYLDVTVNNETGVVGLNVAHEGEYPLYDVNFCIADLQKGDRIAFQVGNAIPNLVFSVGTIQLPSTCEQDYNVFFSARNGHFMQEIRFRRIDGQWKQAIRVRWLTDISPVLERVEPGFPLNGEGKVEWD